MVLSSGLRLWRAAQSSALWHRTGTNRVAFSIAKSDGYVRSAVLTSMNSPLYWRSFGTHNFSTNSYRESSCVAPYRDQRSNSHRRIGLSNPPVPPDITSSPLEPGHPTTGGGRVTFCTFSALLCGPSPGLYKPVFFCPPPSSLPTALSMPFLIAVSRSRSK
jgi:hypothetical protein